jgi:hypothetical protein
MKGPHTKSNPPFEQGQVEGHARARGRWLVSSSTTLFSTSSAAARGLGRVSALEIT